MTGLILAQYRIDAELGRGGMGIVYRATDTKLNRTVAVKVLPPAALGSEDDRARFFREAQAAAQLHHPNIATVFGIDEAVPHGEGKEPQDGAERRPFIAMEFIEGETLHDRIRKGPLRLPEAVSIAVQVAEALKAAHAKNIVHRDVKSANVMLTPDGVAKVLDFGLAKTNQSTMLTRMGSTLGTVAYMSPEQARGQEVDGRSDLYSLGTMLYEMVAGRLPFAGDYEQAIVYGILNEPPEPLTALRTGVPMELERIVGKLLTKEADYRYQGAADLIADLKSLDVSGSGFSRRTMATISGTQVAAAPKAVLPSWVVAGVVTAALVIGALGAWFVMPDSESEPVPVRRMQASLAPATQLYPRLSISADGSTIAYLSLEDDGIHMRVRRLDEEEGRDVAQLDRISAPALSLDGRWIAFSDISGLNRVSTSGGSPEVLMEAESFLIPRWVDDGTLISSTGLKGIFTLALDGTETLVDVGMPEGGTALQPIMIPGTRVILYTRWGAGTAQSEVWAYDLDSKETALVAQRAVWPRYHPSGYVLFYRGADVHAARFDPATLTTGPSFVLQPDVSNVADGAIVLYDISATDLMVYYPGGTFGSGGRNLVVQRAAGGRSQVPVESRDWWDPRFSPEGRSVLAHATGSAGNTEMWLIDLERGAARPLTNSPGEDETPVWAPDGQSFYYSTDGSGFEALVRRSITGIGPVDTLWKQTVHLHVESVSPDGRYVVTTLGGASQDMMLVDTRAPGGVTPLFPTPANETSGRISPDGKWLAYASDEAGRYEVYLATFPGAEVITRVSTEGGEAPVWSRDGRTLYYLKNDDIQQVDMSNPRSPGAPALFQAAGSAFFRQSPHTTYDVYGDQAIFSDAPEGAQSVRHVQVITGLTSLLRSLDPSSPK